MIRRGTLADLPELQELEQICFESDRLSPRSFRRFVSHAQSALLVFDDAGHVAGYAVVLFHANTSLSRLYSLAVHPEARRQGIARQLMEECFALARERGTTRMRLEVHRTAYHVQAFYERMGFTAFDLAPEYYEDRDDAVRMEKPLVENLSGQSSRLPFYEQHYDFSCGPACLIMAFARHRPGIHPDRHLEIALWREATTVFMTSGHGGCSALGLALAAWRRGYMVEAYNGRGAAAFVDTVRDPAKKETIEIVEEGFQREVEQTGIAMRDAPIAASELKGILRNKGVPIVLISSYRLTGSKAPHWIAVAAIDDNFVYINDPFVDWEEEKTATDCIGIPLSHKEFERMSRFGKGKHAAAVIIYPPRPDAGHDPLRERERRT